MARAEYRLLYDGTCRICTHVARWVSWLDVRGPVRVQPIQGSRDLVRGIPDAILASAYHIVDPDGRVTSGGDAVPVLLEALPLGRGLGGLVAGSPSLMRFARSAYAIAVRFRGALTCAAPAASATATCP
ncbi:MAG: DCC1-like thiol-disulfide oxidoreductase family protein [Methanobacteriota archaeon]